MSMRLLFLMYDHFPAFRPDVAVLFGKELHALGIGSDLLGQIGAGRSLDEAKAWAAGKVFVHGQQRSGVLGQFCRPFHDLAMVRRLEPVHRVIQVRDKIRTGLLALVVAKLTGRKMTYWMSFPFAEGFKIRHQQVGRSQGLAVQLLNLLRAACAGEIYYRLLAPRVDHLFVQSDGMLEFMVGKGVERSKMTAVPMGVDVELFRQVEPLAIRPEVFSGRRVLCYLGVLSQNRNSEFLLDVLMDVKRVVPNVFLLLAGDGASSDEQQWMRSEIAKRDLNEHVWLTGWLPQSKALPLLKFAEVGLSPFPRNYILDTNSPTKALEYLALGIPCVCNDNPDQKHVVESSGGGFCVPMTVNDFSAAVIQLLADPSLARVCGEKGQAWVAQNRSYKAIAQRVATVYQSLVTV